MKPEIHIQPNLITWAISRAGHDVEQFINSQPKIQKWLDKEESPTIKQLEKFATKLHIPFGYLFFT